MLSPVVFLGKEASPTLEARRFTSSVEAASLQGKPALTPIIAGSICGGLLIISWTIGFIVYFRKRINRKKRKRLIEAGKAQLREKDLKILQERVIIPPDPAVILGQRQPGEMAFPEREHSSPGRRPWSHQNSKAIPSSDSKGTTSGTSGTNKGSSLAPSTEQEDGRTAPKANSGNAENLAHTFDLQVVNETSKFDISSHNKTGVENNPDDGMISNSGLETEDDIQVTDVMTIPANV